MRRLALFFAALFVAGNVAAAASVCLDGLSAHQHGTAPVAVAGGQQQACPDTGVAAIDQTHCDRNHKSDDPKLLKDVPPAAAFAQAPTVSHAWFDPVAAIATTTSRPSAGPSLTILFGNLRL